MSEPSQGRLLIRHGVGLGNPLMVVRVTIDGKEAGKISNFNAPSPLESGNYLLGSGEHVIEVGIGPFISKKTPFSAVAGQQTILRVACYSDLLIIGGGIPGALVGLLIKSVVPDHPLTPLIIAGSAVFSLTISFLVSLFVPGLVVRLIDETGH